VREAARAGATRAIVAGERVEIARALPIPTEWVAAGTAAPAGARVERADLVAGVELRDGDEGARERAEWALIRRMNKAYEGPVDALINWRFSMRITRVLARRSLRVTPNHVTLVAIAVGLAAAAVATRGTYLAIAVAGLLLETQSIFDSVDGELARLRYQYSKLGQWLDNVSDDVIDNAFIAAIGVALGGLWRTAAFAIAAVRVLSALVQYLDVYRRTGTGDIMLFRWWFEKPTAATTEIYDPRAVSTWLRSFGRRDTYVFLWMLACVAGFPYWVVAHAALIAAVTGTMLLAHVTLFRNRRRTA
jgi:phosphatidylglycerophosphate synthase